MKNKSIKCYVEDCAFCNCHSNECTLEKITVGTYKNKTHCTKDYTFCNSYAKKSLHKS